MKNRKKKIIVIVAIIVFVICLIPLSSFSGSGWDYHGNGHTAILYEITFYSGNKHGISIRLFHLFEIYFNI